MPSSDSRLIMIKPPDSASHLETKESDPPRYTLNIDLPQPYDLLREHQFATASVRTLQLHQFENMPRMNSIPLDRVNFLGQHVMAEFKNISAYFSADDLEAILLEGAHRAGATVLHHAAFNQYPNGDISAIIVIAESHFIIHYLPELNFLAFDAFTCGHINIKAAIDYVHSKIQNQPYDGCEFKRGIRHKSDDRFINGIATLDAANNLRFFKQNSKSLLKKTETAIGQHAIAEFNFSHIGKINDGKHVLNTFKDSLNLGGSPVIQYSYVHPFDNFGITTVMLGQRTHATTHNWPPEGYCAIDVCTFNKQTQLNKVVKHMSDQFEPLDVACAVVPRGVFNTQTRELEPVLSRFIP